MKLSTGPVRTWGRSASATPAEIARPESVEQVAAVVAAARARGLRVKAIGSGHSFTPIALTEGVLVDVSRIAGLTAHDAARRRVTIGAGTRLRDLPSILRPLGLALTNLGDIDAQTIAGAISTGTHGTGLGFGGLATQVVGVTIVTADGSVIRIADNEHAALLPAARISLGVLGILVAVELQCVPTFLMRAVEHSEHVDALDTLYARAQRADHVEAFWWPHTDRLSTKTNTRLPGDAPHESLSATRSFIEDEVLGNGALLAASVVGVAVPRATPTLNRLAAKVYGNRTYTDDSHAVFTSPRRVRFREMEYAIPAQAMPDAMRAIRSLIERRRWHVSFPVEIRFSAADDVWLSPAYGRESAYIAVHRYWRENPIPYFRAVEDVLRGFDGRPHWGKLHGQRHAELAGRYPRMAAFLAARDALDPDRMFANAASEGLLGD